MNFKLLYNRYPRQFWLMILGIVISTAGGSMIWPFMLIYAGGKLGLPLSAVASLISINAGVGLFASFLAGTLADRIGRKAVMVVSLAMIAVAYFFLVQAETYVQFALLMGLVGLSNPLYQVGADAMLADMIPSAQRTDAYAINRIANNAAFGIGPAIGGFLASTSYNLAFYGASAGFLIYSVIWFLFAHETLGKAINEESISALADPVSAEDEAAQPDGYGRVFKDKRYMAFVALVGLGLIAPSILWILMPVYAKTNFGVPEALYGWIPTTNAAMCVFIQYAVTNVTRKYDTLPVVGAGMFIYAIGVGSVALMTGFSGFWLSMVILTFGELTIVPTASKYVADIAPADLRGRYMSLYWFGWGAARTLAPLIGGYLNDNISPRAIWVGGLVIGLTSTLGLFLLNSLVHARSPLPSQPEADA
ncbi:MAG TPA: MFS transporter [Anaerolineales bacterium]|nr:MFS transporter [Anaerolineales bacterium]HNN13096.1 MFS transporter [Anaerolineales bacterium]HNO31358.1 MFS transporter [Anaerolineales bacterium]